MASETSPLVSQVQVLVAKDGLKAWAKLPDSGSTTASLPAAAHIISVLEQTKIEITDAVRTRVDEMATLMGDGSRSPDESGQAEIPNKYLVAEGRPPVEAEDGSFTWHEAFQDRMRDWRGDGQVNYYSLNSILTVDAGTAIGRITQPHDGVPGRDVFGREVAPRCSRGLPMLLDSGLQLSAEDPREVVTLVAGRVVIAGKRMRVEEVLHVPGNIDFESGNIDACINVHVRGTVRSNFSVRSTQSLTVEKAIEAARVAVGHDVTVRGGILGNDCAGRVRAGGTITARFCEEARIDAGADLCIDREMIGSVVRVNGRLLIENGTIIGGRTHARGGLAVRVLGSDANVKTPISLGIDPRALAEARALEQEGRNRTRTAEQIREKVQPLMANLKRLSPAQREQATELLAKADEMEWSIDDLEKKRTEMLEAARPPQPAQAIVSRQILPGVRISFGTRMAIISQVIHGPVLIEERKINGATEIVAVNQRTGSVTVMPVVEIDLDELRQAHDDDGETDGADESPGDDKAT
ncbi:MAG: FapA family protein [Planctomycetes bacterium]|nr:FapA family protein [Planctomycetota bacterium]